MKLRHLLFALLACSLFVAACGSSSDDTDSAAETTSEDAGTDDSGGDAAASSAPGDGPEIVIGAQDFGESAILAEVYGQALSGAGYTVTQQPLGGFRDLVYTSFDSGDINFTPEYAASAADFLSEGTASSDIDATMTALQSSLEARNLRAYAAAPAIDSNSFVVTTETAGGLSSPSVSALTEDMVLGAAPDCPDNPSCIPGLQDVYGLDLSANFVPLDGSGPLTKAALDAGEIDVAVMFSTDSSIADNSWVVLDDDKKLFNADNIVPVVSTEVSDAYGDAFAELIDKVSAALTTEDLTEMNRRYDIDKADASDVAKEWLEANGLLG